ncbi:hypothetical protein I3842_15G066900 [Carya illinoinensis]|uniref:Uncharacterized protein n=1 Tax=Carya illinoinensis TaxID=32201 RepID=A0A922AA06_CARIL|nr:hypothetical protein I3842_15G066900 [Carya illinoinensis]
MATTRLLRSSRPLNLGLAASSSSSSSFSLSRKTVRCLSKEGFNGEKIVSANGERKSVAVASKAASVAAPERIVTSAPGMSWGILDFDSLIVANVSHAVVILVRTAVKQKRRKMYIQMFLEKAIVDCRFFTLLAVAGSLLGSVLCFLEGCFTIVESYLQYFHSLSHKADQGHVMQLLIEAIDMFLIGTAMLMFGMGLYVIFVGKKTMTKEGPRLSGSNLFGLFYMKTLPAWVEKQSVSQAKSKIGHAVMMILQVGVLEKFKNVPMVTGVDLACFAGAVLISSASIFLLSRLSSTVGSITSTMQGR